jgi:hypothetical protein
MGRRPRRTGLGWRVDVRYRALIAALLATILALPAAVGVDSAAASKRSPKVAKKLRLVRFDRCSDLIGYARRYAGRVEQYYSPGSPLAIDSITAPLPPRSGGDTGVAGGQPTAAPPTPTAAPTVPEDTSTTNVQEAGVDEPDVVKTDGKTIFTVANGDLQAVDARSPQPKLLQTLELYDQGQQLLLSGDKLLVIGTRYLDTSPAQPAQAPGGPAPTVAPVPSPYYQPITFLTEVDVSDPAKMTPLRSQTIEGSFVSARMVGDTARVVVTSPPEAFVPGAPDSVAKRTSGWIPRSAVLDRRTGKLRRASLVKCGAVRHPRSFSGLDMLTVLTIDMSRGLPAVDTDSLMTSAGDVYGSAGSLYVATTRWTPPPTTPDQPPPKRTTAIHRFDTSEAGSTTYKASGEVPGYVLNQFALSEYKGVLRVASTTDPEWWNGAQTAQSQSYVTTLAERDGALQQLGQVGGLGEGERIFGVRFIDDTGYVVTFRQTDPLYTVDLSSPSAPRVLGELKLLGYSAYLHPIGRDLLLGVGRDATDQGRRLGVQLSVFDVSDLANVQRVQQRALSPSSSTSAEFDHHAFLWWRPRNLAVIPVSEYGSSGPPFLGAVGFRVGRSAIDEVGRVEHTWPGYPAMVDRSLVVGDRLFTVSGFGVKANDLNSFGDIGHADFPAPPPGDPVYPVDCAGPCGVAIP